MEDIFTSMRLCRIKKNLIRALLHQTNITLQVKELNTREDFMKEQIHWCYHPLYMKSPISLPNQNKTLNLVFLWEICAFLVDGPDGVDVSLHEIYDSSKARSKLWHCPYRITCTAIS